MKKILILLLLIAAVINSAPIKLKGTVVETGTNLPLANAIVMLHQDGRMVLTDATGAFVFYDTITAIGSLWTKGVGSTIRIVGNNQVMVTTTGNNIPVSLKVYSLQGRVIATFSKRYATGVFSISLAHLLKTMDQVYVVDATIDNEIFRFRLNSVGTLHNAGKSELQPQAGAVRAATDTVTATKYGYAKTMQVTLLAGTTVALSIAKQAIDSLAVPGMRLLPGGWFEMGDKGGDSDEYPHDVKLSPFYIDTIEVKQTDYEGLLNIAPWKDYDDTQAGGTAPRLPVWYIHWYDAVVYCNARSKRDGLDTMYTYTGVKGKPGNGCTLTVCGIDWAKRGYRLPTEAEWEYAARAGTSTMFYWGNAADVGTLYKYAWVSNSNMDKKIHPGAERLPNAFGLYDVIGNANEFANDFYDGEYYQQSEAAHDTLDPKGPLKAEIREIRVARGGGWYIPVFRCADRYGADPDSRKQSFNMNGFRCVLSAKRQ